MAKELEKLTKEFAPLKKQATALVDTLPAVGTNISHMLGMLGECCDEVTRRAGELRKLGNPGTTLKDFADDKDIKTVLAEAANADKKLLELVKKTEGIHAEGRTVAAALKKMLTGLDKEIADRKKKKDRTLFAVDSASLPELEKLAGQIQDMATTLNDEVVTYLDTTPPQHDPADTQRKLNAAAAKSASVQLGLDEKALDKQGLNLRLLGKNLAVAKGHREDVTTHLKQALLLLKQGQAGHARDAVEKATTARQALQNVAEPYERAMKGKNKYDLMAMEQSKDGQTLLAATRQIAKYDDEAGKELDTILSKVKF